MELFFCGRNHVYNETVFRSSLEPDNSIFFGVESEIRTHPDIKTGINLCAALAHYYGARVDILAAESLHAETLPR